jgi:hypothetical protein
MCFLYGLEELAYERVDELRRQGDRARFMRSLPRDEWIVRRGMRRIGRLLKTYPTLSGVRVFMLEAPRKVDEACGDT